MAMGAAGPALRGSAASAATAQHGGWRSILSSSEDGRTIAARKRRWKGAAARSRESRNSVWAKCRTARRSSRRAGRTRGGRVLSADRIDPRAILAFGGNYSQAHLLAERAGKKAAHTMG